ncbi:hypothetical protein ACH5RR_038738, partial [Cinchona calisaya]
MATSPIKVKSHPLHNFSLPHLKWAHKNHHPPPPPPPHHSNHHRFPLRDSPENDSANPPSFSKPPPFACSSASPQDQKSAEQRTDDGVEEEGEKQWKLRPRKLAVSFQTGKTTSYLGKCNGNEGSREEEVGPERQKRNKAVVDKKKRKIWISLTKEEIEEDVYSLTGSRPSRRPKKRPRNLQKHLDNVFPGLYLVGMSVDSYRVHFLEALDHLASIDPIELCNEAKVEHCRATRDLRNVTDVCMDESAVSSDPVIAFLLDEVVVKDWCKRTFKNILADLQVIYNFTVEQLNESLCSLLKFPVKLAGLANVLDVLESSFKGSLSAKLHDLYHLQENILKTKQHMEIITWCTRHKFLENVKSRHVNIASWRSQVRERKSAAIRRAWPDLFLYYLFDRHWTIPEDKWRDVVDDFAATCCITRHSLLESFVFYLLDDHTDEALQCEIIASRLSFSLI